MAPSAVGLPVDVASSVAVGRVVLEKPPSLSPSEFTLPTSAPVLPDGASTTVATASSAIAVGTDNSVAAALPTAAVDPHVAATPSSQTAAVGAPNGTTATAAVRAPVATASTAAIGAPAVTTATAYVGGPAAAAATASLGAPATAAATAVPGVPAAVVAPAAVGESAEGAVTARNLEGALLAATAGAATIAGGASGGPHAPAGRADIPLSNALERAPVASGAASSAPAATVPVSGAAGTAAGAAAARERGAAAASNRNSPLMRRLAKYVSAVTGKGASAVPTAALRALGALVAAAEEAEAHLGLGLLVHASGVDAAGNVGFLILAGKGKYADPDVLRVLSDVHQFARAGDVLPKDKLASGSRSARLVGAATRPTPVVAPLPAISDEDMELNELMTSPFDDDLPPPVEWQRLARRVCRSRSHTPPHASEEETDRSTDAIPAPATTSMPFQVESILPPPVYMPEQEIEDILRELMGMAAASKLVRNILKVIVILLAAKFGVHPRMMQEGLSRWWSHRLIVNPAGDGQVVGRRWPLGVSVPLRLLPVTQRTRGAENGVAGGPGRRVVFLSSIPNSDRCTQEEAIASLLLLWGKESRVRKPIRTALFRAQLAQQAKKNRAAAASRRTTDAAAASRRATDAVAASAAAVAPGAAAVSSVGAAGRGTHGAHHHVVIAPRTWAAAGGGGAPAATSAATNGTAVQGALGGSSVVQARAAARAAATTGPVFSVRPPAHAATPTGKRGSPEASGGNPNKRGRHVAARQQGVAAGAALSTFAAATAVAAATALVTTPAPTGPLVSAIGAVLGVDDGPHDLLDAEGLQVGHGVVHPTRKVLHGRALADNLVVVLLEGVFNPRCIYTHEAEFPVEPPGVSTRVLGDAIGSFIVWDRELILPA